MVPIRPLVLKGSPYECGSAHGRGLRAEISCLIDRWKAELAVGFRMDADSVIRSFLANTDFLTAIRRHTPGMLDEIRGIADGSEQPYETIVAFQLLDEFWANGHVVTGGHCTSIGLHRGNEGKTWLAQNVDVETFRDGCQAVLRIKSPDTNMDTFVLTSAGLIGFNGMNDRGIGVCCNGLPSCNSRLDGLPVACVVRGVLAQSDMGAALDFLKRIPHASGQNYMVACPERFVDMECSANQAAEYGPEGASEAVWHANLPLANTDTNEDYRHMMKQKKKSPFRINNETRLQSVAKQLKKEAGLPPLALLKKTLASRHPPDNPICAPKAGPGFFHQIGIYSFAATILELTPDPAMCVSFKPEKPESYTRLTFD